ncbi:DUF1566 domain-containing protein [Spirochaetota bacterium]
MKIIHLSIIIVLAVSLFGCKPPRTNMEDPRGSNRDAAMDISISPGGNTADFLPNSNIVLTFVDAVDIYSDWMVTIDGTVYTIGTWSDGNTALTITPVSNFVRFSTITVFITGFKVDYDGYSFPDKDFTFTVANDIPQLITVYDPSDNASDILQDSNITVTFSEEMDVNGTWSVVINGTVYIKDSPEALWNGNTLIINPNSEFNRERTYSVSFSGFTAINDGALLPDKTLSFFTTSYFMITDTGQTQCYWEVEASTWQIDDSCSQTYTIGNSTHPFGQDSHYSNIPNATFTGPTKHVTYNDYTTYDTITKLIWKTCTEGYDYNGSDCMFIENVSVDWQDANITCNTLNSANSGIGYSGRKDWRVPTISELISIVDYSKSGDAINSTYFPGILGNYWSSSICGASSPPEACTIVFSDGQNYQSSISNNHKVRCVSGP